MNAERQAAAIAMGFVSRRYLVFASSSASLASTAAVSWPRMAKRVTSTPSSSSAKISRRMKVWLIFGYWLIR
jgi:hypothetical protein